MPFYYSETDDTTEPKSRFYPPQGIQPAPATLQTSPGRPAPSTQTMSGELSRNRINTILLRPYKKEDDVAYFAHRHPISLQRLYEAADALLNTYPRHGFIYDAYPDALSLQLMRDRLLRENTSLTEEFLQAGCPIAWLNLLTDTVLSEQLIRCRQAYRSPNGEASTTSVQSRFRS